MTRREELGRGELAHHEFVQDQQVGLDMRGEALVEGVVGVLSP